MIWFGEALTYLCRWWSYWYYIRKTLYDSDPYTLAYQVHQVFYIGDSIYKGSNWQVVQKTYPCDLYNEGLFDVLINSDNDDEVGGEQDSFQ